MSTHVGILNIALPKRLIMAGVLTGFGGFFTIPFHMLSLGSAWMPLFIPIGLAACMVEPYIAVAVGILLPLLTALQTGMPSFTPPFIWLVTSEALAYAFVISLARFKWNWPVHYSVLAGILAGKIALLIYLFIFGHPLAELYPSFEIRQAAGTLWAFKTPWITITKGIPGGLLALIVIPLIVYLIDKHSSHNNMAAA